MSYREKAMKNARISLPIYEQVNELINKGVVGPYDDYLVDFLATHTDQSRSFNNYLDSLNSRDSIGKASTYIRYLSLGIKEPFILNKGNLSALHGGYFPQCWIETEKYVYDVSFAGKWPKNLYYELFKPIDIEKINLERDQEYKKYLVNNAIAKYKSDEPFLKYIGWYGYTRDLLTGWPSYLSFWNFPQDKEKAKRLSQEAGEENKLNRIRETWQMAIMLREKSVLQHPLSDWTPLDLDDNIEIPSELLLEEFYSRCFEVIDDVCTFISLNRGMYDAKKYDGDDLTLLIKATKGNYSGKFCSFISEIPVILHQIEENESKQPKKH